MSSEKPTKPCLWVLIRHGIRQATYYLRASHKKSVVCPLQGWKIVVIQGNVEFIGFVADFVTTINVRFASTFAHLLDGTLKAS